MSNSNSELNKDRLRTQKAPFTQAPNDIINDKNMSLKAKGLFLFMLSKPDDWNFTLQSISKQVKDGVGSIRSAMNELKELGYLTYQKKNDGYGVYYLSFEPKCKNPNMENCIMQKPQRISNTDLNSKKDSSKPLTPKQGESFDFNLLLQTINKYTGREFKTINKDVQRKFNARLKDGYTKQNIMNAIINASNSPYHVENGRQYLTPEFLSRASTLDKYGTATATPKQEQTEYVGTVKS